MKKIEIDFSEERRGKDNPRQLHHCSACENDFFWNKDSCWFGSYKEAEDGDIQKACSENCGKFLWGEDYLTKISGDNEK